MMGMSRVLAALVAVLGACYFAITTYWLPGWLQDAVPQVEQLAQEYIHGSVKLGALEWNGRLTVAATDVQLFDQEQQLVARVPRAELSVNPLKATMGVTHALTEVRLFAPEAWLREKVLSDGGSQWNVEMRAGQFDVGLAGTVDAGSNPDYALDVTASDLQHPENQVRAQGLVDKKLKGRLAVQGDFWTLAPYTPVAEYYSGQRYHALCGQLKNVDVVWTNDGRQVRLSGGGQLEQVGGTATFDGEEYRLLMTGPVDFADSVAHTDGLTLAVNDQQALLTGRVDFTDLHDPQGAAELVADRLELAGYTIANLHVPVVLGDRQVTLAGARARVGDGTVRAEGSWGLENHELAGLVTTERLAVNLPQQAGDVVVTGAFGARGELSTKKQQVNLLTDTAELAWQGETFRVLDADVDVDLLKETFTVNNFSVRAGQTGAALATGSGTLSGNFDLTGRISEFPVQAALRAAGETGMGEVSGSFHAWGSPDNVNFEGMTQLQRAKLRGFDVAEAHGMVTLRDKVLTMRDYKVHMLQGTHRVEGTVDLRGAEPVLNVTAHTQQVRVEPFAQLAADVAGKPVPLTGNLTNVVQLQGTPSHARVTGEVHLTDGSYDGYLIDEITGRYAYEDGAVTLTDGVVRALSTTLQLSGHMDKAQHLDFVARGTNVDLERLPIKDETAKLAGFVNLEGTLTGTLEQPWFAGTVQSDSFTVNGEEIRHLQGTLGANGKDRNVLVASCEQSPVGDALFGGLYAMNFDLNLVEKYLKGDVNISDANVRSLLKMAGTDYPVDGRLTGALRFMPYGKNSGVVLDATVSRVQLHGQGPYHATAQAHLQRGVLTLDNVKLEEVTADQWRDDFTGGYIVLGGSVDLKQKQLALEAGAVNVNPSIITAMMTKPVEFKGSLNGLVQLGGTFDNPAGNGSVEIADGSVAGVDFDKAIAMVSLQDDNIQLEQVLCTRDEHKVSAYGNVPVDLFRAKTERRNPAAQMDVTMDLRSAGLGVLAALEPVEWGLGDTDGVITASGTLEEPLFNGSLKVHDGVLKLRDVETLVDKINLDVAFAGDTIQVNQLSTVLGKGTLEGSGDYKLRSGEEEAYAINLKATNASIQSQMVSGRLNGTLAVKPQKYRERPPKNRPLGWQPTTKYRALVQADVKLDDVMLNLPTIPEMSEGGGTLGLDVQVTLGDRIHLYNKYLYDLWLGGGVHVRGSTDFPVIEGRVEAKRGTVTYLSRTQFRIQSAFVNWLEPGNVYPNVNVKATTKFDRYRVYLDVTGPLEEMDLKLTSEPQLSRDKIMRMLMLQRVSTTGDDVTGEDLQNLAAAGLQTLLLGDMEYLIKQTLGIDEFRLYMGRLNAGIEMDRLSSTHEPNEDERNQYNVLLAKDLWGDKWRVGYTSSFNGESHKIYTQYNINEKLNFTVSSDQDRDRMYTLEYRITF